MPDTATAIPADVPDSQISMTTEPPKRRWLQFRLRTLLIAILVLSLPLSWFAVRMERARRQREAVEAIERTGGFVTLDPIEPWAPSWACTLLGSDFFVDVVQARCSKNFGDTEAAHLKALPRLNELGLTMSKITTVGYGCFRELAGLKKLSLNFMPIKDCDFEQVAELAWLEELDISDCSMLSEAGFQHVEKLTSLRCLELGELEGSKVELRHVANLRDLESLSLAFAEISDAHLEQLGGMPNLRWLNLSCTRITSDGLRHLEGLTNLKHLTLNQTDICDSGLENLRRLPQLEILEMRMTDITDSGLQHLQYLLNLRQLSIEATHATPDGAKKLQDALPNCSIPLAYDEQDY